MGKSVTKKFNVYNINGEYGIGYDCNNKQFYFDTEDYDKIKCYCWYVDEHGYVRTIRNNKKIYLHRFVMNIINDKNIIVDHINRNRNDCRKSNLRLVNDTQSAINKGIKSNNTSGTIGVSFSKLHQKWESYITVNKKRIHLGIFKDYDDAVKVRKEAEEKYFGEYAPEIYKENII